MRVAQPVTPLCFSDGVNFAEAREECGGKVQPEEGGMHLLAGHGELPCPDVFHGVELDSF